MQTPHQEMRSTGIPQMIPRAFLRFLLVLATQAGGATLEVAKAQFQKSWDAWKAWAKMEEAP
jgi:hypothetical protein